MTEGAATEPAPVSRPPLHSTNDFYKANLADRAIAERAADTPARHVWVSTVDGHVPGLLLAWDRRSSGWFGLVVHLQRGHPGSSPWVTVLD